MGLSLRCRPLAVLSRVSRNLWWNLRTTVAARLGRAPPLKSEAEVLEGYAREYAKAIKGES